MPSCHEPDLTLTLKRGGVMCPKKNWPWRLVVKSLTLLFVAPVTIFAQPAPRSVTIGSHPPGTVFYALASGGGQGAGERGPQLVVQPYSGTSTFLPLLDTGE